MMKPIPRSAPGRRQAQRPVGRSARPRPSSGPAGPAPKNGVGLCSRDQPLRDFLERTGLLDEIGRDHVYPRVSDAVDAYLDEATDLSGRSR
jgi:hypothetical protein